MAISRVARAKVNLCLHVTGQRDDGYHLLDSVVAFAEYGDVLFFEPAENVTLTIGGPFSGGLSSDDDNLILLAARCFGVSKGAAIHLEKNLPVASGIGGGSADAAATLRGLSELWDEPMPDLEAQLSLGADVPVCVVGEPVKMQGIGEEITTLSGWQNLHVVLVNPGVGVSTPAVFGGLKSKNNPSVSARQDQSFMQWLHQQRNDLQAPAISAVPVIAEVLSALEQTGAQLARMSGSGATCFGVFPDAGFADQAGQKIQRENPDWWVQTTRLTT